MEGISRENIKKEMVRLKDAPHRVGIFSEAYQCARQLCTPQDVLRGSQPAEIGVLSQTPAKKCGFIVWKDRSVVTIYSNGLTNALNGSIMRLSKHATRSGSGLTETCHWKGTESLRGTIVELLQILLHTICS